jgi:glycosyltransferase involved in cell wall biosynthesis
MNPVISVIIPTRSRPQLLQRAIVSALAQTESRIEIVVVIDGRDEATGLALDGIEDNRVRRVALDDAVGGAEARNVGARAAKGRWIALLDDDDEWMPDKLAAQLQVAEEAENELVVSCQYVVRRPNHPDVLRPRRFPKPGEPISEYMFDYLCYSQTSTFFCSRNLMLRIPFQKDLPSFQDIDWFLRATTAPGVFFHAVPKPLSIYHSPEERGTITSKLTWEARLAWGRTNRHRMSRRGYSQFIAGSCVARAAQDKAGLRGLFLLLHECILRGSAKPVNVAMILGMFLVPPEMRRRIRDSWFLPAYRGSNS